MSNPWSLSFYVAICLVFMSCSTDAFDYCGEDKDIILEQNALKANGIRYSSITKQDSVYGEYTYSETIFNEDGLAVKNVFYLENGAIFLLDFYKYDQKNRVMKVTNMDSLEHSKTIKTYDYSGNNEYRVDSLYSKGFLVEWIKYVHQDGKYMHFVYTHDGLKYKDVEYRSQTCLVDSIIRFDKNGNPTGQMRYYSYKNGKKIASILVKNNDTIEYHYFKYNKEGRISGITDYFKYDKEIYTNQLTNMYENNLISNMTFISKTMYSDGGIQIDTTINTIEYQTSVPKHSLLSKVDFQ